MNRQSMGHAHVTETPMSLLFSKEGNEECGGQHAYLTHNDNTQQVT